MPWRARTVVHLSCAGGRVARSFERGLVGSWQSVMTAPTRCTVVIHLGLILGASASPAQQEGDTGRIYAEDQANITPVLLRQPLPIYPDSLRRAGIGGTVVVRFTLNTTGHPESASIRVLTTPDSALNASARAMVSGSRFSPAQARGRRVRYLLELPIQFDPRDTAPPPPPVYTMGDSLEQAPKFLRWRWSIGGQPLSPFDSAELALVRASRRVVVLMIIDSLGHPDSASIQIVEPANPWLTSPVAHFAGLMQFRPGRRHGRPVRVLARVPLDFR